MQISEVKATQFGRPAASALFVDFLRCGSKDLANHGFFLSQMLLRGLGCGSGMTPLSKSFHARTVSVRFFFTFGRCHLCAYWPITNVSLMFTR